MRVTCNPSPCSRLTGGPDVYTLGSPVTVDVTGVGGVPASGVDAVALVFQAVNPSGLGYLSAWGGGTWPGTTTITFNGDSVVSGTAIVPVGTDGTITIASSVSVDVVVQAVGWFDLASRAYTYTYAGDGLRYRKTGPDGTTTTFTWDRSSDVPLLLAENIDAPGGTSTDRVVRYIYGPGGTVSEDITTPFAGAETARWYHHDQLGSTTSLTSATGALLGTSSYGPYGAVAQVTGSATTPMSWAGEYRDNETGFTYLRARYYDPSTGQFLSRDPIEAVTREPYAYASGNPVWGTDPTGLGPYHECPTGQVWSEASGGCIMTGSQTPAAVQPGTVGDHAGLHPVDQTAEPICQTPLCAYVAGTLEVPYAPPTSAADWFRAYSQIAVGLFVYPTRGTPFGWALAWLLRAGRTNLNSCEHPYWMLYEGLPRSSNGA